MITSLIAELIVILLVCGNPIMVLSQEESPFKLKFNRGAGSNFVQLFCWESARATDIPDAYFFMDDN